LSKSDGAAYGWWRSVAAIFAAVLLLVLSVVAKRKSARPGGCIHRYNRRHVRDALSRKRRRLRDMLNDPLLVRDMEARYGDLTSLRESVRQWECDGFALQKKEEAEDCIKANGAYVVPWIRIMNGWLVVLASLTMYLSYGLPTVLILLGCFVHLADNVLLHRAATARSSVRGTEQSKKSGDTVLAAVGVPVEDVEVGVPVRIH